MIKHHFKLSSFLILFIIGIQGNIVAQHLPQIPDSIYIDGELFIDNYSWIENDSSEVVTMWKNLHSEKLNEYLKNSNFKKSVQKILTNYGHVDSTFSDPNWRSYIAEFLQLNKPEEPYLTYYKQHGKTNNKITFNNKEESFTAFTNKSISIIDSIKLLQLRHSKNFKHYSISFKRNNSDSLEIKFIEEKTLEFLTDHLENCTSRNYWDHSGEGLYYFQNFIDTLNRKQSHLYYHLIGTTQDQDYQVFDFNVRHQYSNNIDKIKNDFLLFEKRDSLENIYTYYSINLKDGPPIPTLVTKSSDSRQFIACNNGFWISFSKVDQQVDEIFRINTRNSESIPIISLKGDYLDPYIKLSEKHILVFYKTSDDKFLLNVYDHLGLLLKTHYVESDWFTLNHMNLRKYGDHIHFKIESPFSNKEFILSEETLDLTLVKSFHHEGWNHEWYEIEQKLNTEKNSFVKVKTVFIKDRVQKNKSIPAIVRIEDKSGQLGSSVRRYDLEFLRLGGAIIVVYLDSTSENLSSFIELNSIVENCQKSLGVLPKNTCIIGEYFNVNLVSNAIIKNPNLYGNAIFSNGFGTYDLNNFWNHINSLDGHDKNNQRIKNNLKRNKNILSGQSPYQGLGKNEKFPKTLFLNNIQYPANSPIWKYPLHNNLKFVSKIEESLNDKDDILCHFDHSDTKFKYLGKSSELEIIYSFIFNELFPKK